MDKEAAKKEIKKIFSSYKRLSKGKWSWLQTLESGKIYELYCLSRVLTELRQIYGYMIWFPGQSFKFKSSPGLIKTSDPFFELCNPSTGRKFRLYTDIEFQTLGSHLNKMSGFSLSSYHELDLVLVEQSTAGRPKHDEIILGVECKSHAKFDKTILKQVLGIRRELSILTHPMVSRLSSESPKRPFHEVPADPASEYWVAFADPAGMGYTHSPTSFGIEFKHWAP